MQNHFPTWRALGASLVAVIAYVLLSASGAHAQVSISKTDINIENNGTGDANTGRNDLVANDSINVATSTQTVTEEDGTVEQNIGEAVNESEGEASLETGNATAVGNASKTAAIQASATGSAADALIAAAVGTPYGPQPISPLAPSDEAPAEAEESPAAEEESTGSEEGLETGDEGEEPDAGAPDSSTAATEGSTTEGTGGQNTPASALPNSGSAAADAGTPEVPALATSPLDNTVLGAVSGAGPPGITETDQNIDVDNQGDARANTGRNTVVDGDVLTGNATASGNISETMTSQLIAALGDLNQVDQDTTVTNEGLARARTGSNDVDGGDLETGSATATGNRAQTDTSQFALSAGDLNLVDQDIDVNNEGVGRARTGTNVVSDGALETGDADAAGSISATAAFQFAMAAGDQNLVDQAIDADNEGLAIAKTGENEVEDGEVATGDASATGNWAGSAFGQRVITPSSEESTDVEQAIEGENVGDALALTGENLAVAGEDGEVSILTGDALAIGNRSAVAASQDA
jgi:hypothetical protein